MLRSYITMILLLLPANQFKAVDTQETCNNLLCNNEAFCKLESGNPFCQCIGSTYFNGQYCEQQINNCASSPCQNGSPCTNALGQPICGPCPTNFGGHLCDVEVENILTKIYFHHNRYGYVASDQNFLFMVESLGEKSFLLELYADSYAIEAFSTNPLQTNRWRKSYDLRAVVRRLGLHHADKLPYISGYYYVTQGRFWESGSQKLRLKVFDKTSLISYMDQAFTIQINPQRARCRPKVELVHCSDPFQPQILDIAQFNMLFVIVQERCWIQSQMKFTWKVYNSVETVLLHSYGETTTPRMKIKPYPGWASHSAGVMQIYLISIGITETYLDKTAHIVKRCYIFVNSKSVVARIIGGLEREVNTESIIHLDGSRSRDLAIPPENKPSLYYKWSCKSTNDPLNQYCNNLKSTEESLFIPRGKLQIGNSYDFTLIVQSEIYPFSKGQTTQSIIPVNSLPLNVDIECVRNCAQQKFVPQQLLHLKAVCWDCGDEVEKEYTWRVNGNQVAKTKRLIVEKPTNEETLTIEVQLVSGERQGKSIIRLNRNNAPTKGDCRVSPSSGIEYETEFQISCSNFGDIDLPLSYEFAIDTVTLDRTSESSTKVRLPKGNALNIKVCDSLLACTTQKISVDVTENRVEGDSVETFLQKYGRSLRQLITDGAIEQAMILAAAAVRLISSEKDAKYLATKMHQFDLVSLLDIEQYFYVIREILKNMGEFKSEGANALYIVLNNINTGFRTVLTDGDVRQMSLMMFDEFQRDVATLLNALEEQKEEFIPILTIKQPCVNSYDRIAESYTEMDINDPTVLPRINAWFQFSSNLDLCIRLLGQIASYTHKPEEPKSITEQSTIRFETFRFEQNSPLVIKTPDGIAEIVIGVQVLKEIKMILRSSNVLLQLITTPKNPFWWYPDGHDVETGVLYVSGFSQKMLDSIALRKTINVTFKLNNAEALQTPDSSTYMHGRIVDNADMNIFEILVPENALLLITFVSTTIDLRVALQSKPKPTGYMTHKSKTIIRKGGSTLPLRILNQRSKSLKVYLAIVPLKKMNHGEAPAFFDFIPMLRRCLSWDIELIEPQWTGAHCWPTETISIDNGLQCHCRHMSTYVGQIYPTVGFSLYDVGGLLGNLPFNWLMLCSQLALGLMFISWVFLSYFNLDPNRECLVVMPKMSHHVEKEITHGEVIVRLVTGGDLVSTTTAGIFLIIYTVRGPLQYKIYQNPMRPQLKNHSTCIAKVPLNPLLIIRPLSLHIKHDGGGRYPTWYLHCLEVIYDGLKKPIKFNVETWLSETGMDLNEIMSEKPRRHEKWLKFKENLEAKYANWFLLNPLFGPWKYGNQTFNRFERTIIWIIKLSLTILIISIYFGWTSLQNYEKEREQYRYLNIHPLKILTLSLICFLVGCTIQLVIKLLLLKCNYEVTRNAV